VYCNVCGSAIPENAPLCSHCGVNAEELRKARRATSNWARPQLGRRIGGVCMGIGRHFDLNVTILRIVWVLLFLFYGIGGILYLALWALMPNEA